MQYKFPEYDPCMKESIVRIEAMGYTVLTPTEAWQALQKEEQVFIWDTRDDGDYLIQDHYDDIEDVLDDPQVFIFFQEKTKQ